jgi:hypothetical protein
MDPAIEVTAMSRIRLIRQPPLSHLQDLVCHPVDERLEPFLVVGDEYAWERRHQQDHCERTHRAGTATRDLVRDDAVELEQPVDEPHGVNVTTEVRHPSRSAPARKPACPAIRSCGRRRNHGQAHIVTAV